MTKVPYDLIAIEADRLIIRMVLSSLYGYTFYLKYLLYLSACGWTDKEFDLETLRRIDCSWEEKNYLLN